LVSAPKIVRSAPWKSEVMAISLVDVPISSPSRDRPTPAREQHLCRGQQGEAAAAEAGEMAKQPAHQLPSHDDRIDIGGVTTSADRQAHADGQHQQREQRAQLLAAQLLPDAHAVLRADHAGDHQDEGKHDIDGM
jgi:hypothetical protein